MCESVQLERKIWIKATQVNILVALSWPPFCRIDSTAVFQERNERQQYVLFFKRGGGEKGGNSNDICSMLFERINPQLSVSLSVASHREKSWPPLPTHDLLSTGVILNWNVRFKRKRKANRILSRLYLYSSSLFFFCSLSCFLFFSNLFLYIEHGLPRSIGYVSLLFVVET